MKKLSLLKICLHFVLAGIVFCVGFRMVFLGDVFAANPTMYLYPDSGFAVLNQEFSVDVMLDTGGTDLKSVRAVFRFDPAQLQVTQAQHGELFCQYPEDGYSVDNDNGWVMMTGFCQDVPYNSGAEPGLFGRITFTSLIEDDVILEFEFDGSDDAWQTWMLDTMSPPQMLSMDRPAGGTYTVVTEIPSSQADTTNTADSGKLPGVGVFEDKWFIIGFGLVSVSVILIIIDRFMYYLKKMNNDNRTIVIQ